MMMIMWWKPLQCNNKLHWKYDISSTFPVHFSHVVGPIWRCTVTVTAMAAHAKHDLKKTKGTHSIPTMISHTHSNTMEDNKEFTINLSRIILVDTSRCSAQLPPVHTVVVAAAGRGQPRPGSPVMMVLWKVYKSNDWALCSTRASWQCEGVVVEGGGGRKREHSWAQRQVASRTITTATGSKTIQLEVALRRRRRCDKQPSRINTTRPYPKWWCN